jgi:hypothetical protein
MNPTGGLLSLATQMTTKSERIAMNVVARQDGPGTLAAFHY